MAGETYISSEIDSADSKAQYDEHVRRILKDKNILAYILKYSVREFADYSLGEARASIEGEPEVAARHVHLDAVHALENESNIPGYDLVTRGIIYPARLLSQQMDVEYTADNYDGVKKVYSIWICMNTPDRKRSYKRVADSIVEYTIKPTILYPPDGTVENISTGRYDLMSTVFINLNSSKTVESKNTLISMLSTLLSTDIRPDEKKQVLEKDYGIPMSIELEKEVNSMCNLSEAIEEQGIEKGIEKGLVQGIERGKSITIYDLVQTEIITPEVGAEKLGVTVDELKSNMKAAGFHTPE